MKGIVIAGTHSGSGKTTVALGLMAAFARQGLKVCGFKVGPDFIDPGYHRQICGTVSRNLDGWMLTKEYNRKTFERCVPGFDLAVVEGVMGLFDGYDGSTEAGSTAEMAKWLGIPVVLVVDARSMARSAAALIYGFENFDRTLDLAGVVFNRVGSPTHLAYLKEAMAGNVQAPCLGGLPREPGLALPERHLGLVTNEENPLSPDYIERLADTVDRSIDLETILARLADVPKKEPVSIPSNKGYRVRIGVARDEAFCFYYKDNLEILESFGAELVFFSPLRDKGLPERISGLYLGGGYPELFARRLSENLQLKEEIRRFSQKDGPIYAECGGLMFLSHGIQDTEGGFYPMAGVYTFSVRMISRLKSLGYREVKLAAPCPLGDPGQVIRGHEFHYSELMNKGPMDVQLAYTISGRRGKKRYEEGFVANNTLASYVHLHFGSNPELAGKFVHLCSKCRPCRVVE